MNSSGLVQCDKQISQVEAEIRTFVSESKKEKETLLKRIDELDTWISEADANLIRCERARFALTGDTKPSETEPENRGYRG